MTGRYQVRALYADGLERDEGASDDMGEALGLIIGALVKKEARYAYQTDVRPDELRAVTEAERAALAQITPQMPRTMG